MFRVVQATFIVLMLIEISNVRAVCVPLSVDIFLKRIDRFAIYRSIHISKKWTKYVVIICLHCLLQNAPVETRPMPIKKISHIILNWHILFRKPHDFLKLNEFPLRKYPCHSIDAKTIAHIRSISNSNYKLVEMIQLVTRFFPGQIKSRKKCNRWEPLMVHSFGDSWYALWNRRLW